MKLNHVIVISLIAVVILSGCTKMDDGYKNNSDSVSKQGSIFSNIFKNSENRGCSGSGSVMFKTSPMNLEDVSMILPMGLMIGGHVTPIDHMYFSPINFQSAPDTYDVYSIGKGVITQIGLEGPPVEPNVKVSNKYRLVIYYTCDFYAIYNLITSLSPRILSITGEIAPRSNIGTNIQVEDGELLGKIGGQTLDLSVNYDKVVLKGFIVPEHYERESWKIHTVDPLDYFTEPLRTQMLAKDVRQVEPRGGKIDYDIDGRLVGNWFVEGTNGYAGNNPSAYWDTHLSMVYDAIDPSFIVVSLGKFDGESKQFGVKGNAPDPATVSKESGIVKYELMVYHYFDGSGEMLNGMTTFKNDLKANVVGDVKGTVLFQLLEDRRLKVETFPGKTADQVGGFTSSAVVYER